MSRPAPRKKKLFVTLEGAQRAREAKKVEAQEQRQRKKEEAKVRRREKREVERREKKQKKEERKQQQEAKGGFVVPELTRSNLPKITFVHGCYYYIKRMMEDGRPVSREYLKFDKEFFQHFNQLPLVAMNLTNSNLPAGTGRLHLQYVASQREPRTRTPFQVYVRFVTPRLGPFQSTRIAGTIIDYMHRSIPPGLAFRTLWGFHTSNSSSNNGWQQLGLVQSFSPRWKPEPTQFTSLPAQLDIRTMWPGGFRYHYRLDQKGSTVTIFRDGKAIGQLYSLQREPNYSGGLGLIFRGEETRCEIPADLKEELLAVDRDMLQEPGLIHVYENRTPKPRSSSSGSSSSSIRGAYSVANGNLGFALANGGSLFRKMAQFYAAQRFDVAPETLFDVVGLQEVKFFFRADDGSQDAWNVLVYQKDGMLPLETEELLEEEEEKEGKEEKQGKTGQAAYVQFEFPDAVVTLYEDGIFRVQALDSKVIRWRLLQSVQGVLSLLENVLKKEDIRSTPEEVKLWDAAISDLFQLLVKDRQGTPPLRFRPPLVLSGQQQVPQQQVPQQQDLSLEWSFPSANASANASAIASANSSANASSSSSSSTTRMQVEPQVQPLFSSLGDDEIEELLSGLPTF